MRVYIYTGKWASCIRVIDPVEGDTKQVLLHVRACVFVPCAGRKILYYEKILYYT
jgi:hypothetical protein